MMMYDTILYGNGLTSALINKINGLPGMTATDRAVSKINDRICSMISIPVDSPNYKKILKLFGLCSREQSDFESSLNNHRESKKFLNGYLPEIRRSGLEVFAGNHFGEQEVRSHIEYLYALYNCWYKDIETTLFAKPVVIDYLEKVVDAVGSQFHNILTLNFDQFLDNAYLNRKLPVQHLHGRFVEQIGNYGDVQFFTYEGGTQFEYSYLFGANAFEKSNRLHRIHTHETQGHPNYDLDFFFGSDTSYGNLLLYGISFTSSGIFSEDFLEAFPEHRGIPGTLDYYLVNSLDGHVLYKIQEKLDQRRIDHVTIAYYSEKDREHLETLLASTPIWDNLTLCQCREVAFSSDLKLLLE